MKMLRRLSLFLLLVGSIAAVIAWTFPADVAMRWFAPEMGPVQVSGVSGTVWDGRARSINAFGHSLGVLDWKLQKTPLLSRRLVADLDIAGSLIEARAQVSREADGSLAVSTGTFHLPAQLLEPALDIPSLKLLGTIEGTLDEARLQGGWLSMARGHARWTQAGVTGDAEARFGDVLADFAGQPDGSISGTVRDDGTSNLIVDGQFVVHAGQFDATARLSVRNDDAQTREALRFVGEPQMDGSSLLKIHGQLFKLL